MAEIVGLGHERPEHDAIKVALPHEGEVDHGAHDPVVPRSPLEGRRQVGARDRRVLEGAKVPKGQALAGMQTKVTILRELRNADPRTGEHVDGDPAVWIREHIRRNAQRSTNGFGRDAARVGGVDQRPQEEHGDCARRAHGRLSVPKDAPKEKKEGPPGQ